MIHQYGAQRHRLDARGKQVGTIPVGEILYIQDGHRPLGFNRHHQVVRRNPWMVMAWLNREYHPAVPNRPHTTYHHGGHLALVKSLRDGRETTVADWILQQCQEL